MDSLTWPCLIEPHATSPEPCGSPQPYIKQEPSATPYVEPEQENCTLLSFAKQDISQVESIPDIRQNGKQSFLNILWFYHKNTNFLPARPSITWVGHAWRRGPRYISHRDLQPLLRTGDCIQRRSDRPRVIKKNIILDRRSHLKKLFVRFEKVVQRHFLDEVCLSNANEVDVDVSNVTYEEDLTTSGLLSEKPEVSGQVTFDMKFTVVFK
jgi:hypothetical protein